MGPILVDDQYMYACLAGELTRVSLTDQSKRVLTEDCGGSWGVSILGVDEGLIYYLARRGAVTNPPSPGFHFSNMFPVSRVAKTAVK